MNREPRLLLCKENVVNMLGFTTSVYCFITFDLCGVMYQFFFVFGRIIRHLDSLLINAKELVN